MMQWPDVIAWEVEAGKACLRAAGIEEIKVLETKPPRAKISIGASRIIRQRELPDNGVELVIARESYE